ncbi:MAG: DUF3078 domain-containing protein [Muribaculaceae bacterium]|nr:DUF3078 domain-containing protein [Muribaculaceae bacterium]
MRKGLYLVPGIIAVILLSPIIASAQIPVDLMRLPKKSSVKTQRDTMVILPWFDEEIADDVCLLDSMNIEPDTVMPEPPRVIHSIPLATYGTPMIYEGWQYLDSLQLIPTDRGPIGKHAFEWIDDINFGYLAYNRARQNYWMNYPDKVTMNVANLPEPPAHYNAFVDPVTTRIVLEEQVSTQNSDVNNLLDIQKINWIQNFSASAQFSQSYISPNWYQGGNRSLLAIVNLIYNVKLNQKLHPKLLFETTVSYKLGVNSAPDDTVRSYNISEDLFQIISTFGYKAIKRWYYSANLQFKTQVLNSYKANSNTLRSAFMSPGELNLGIGMTYEYTNKRKTFNFNASIAPLSWQLRTCYDGRMNEQNYDIKPGHHGVSKYGSSVEYNLNWKVTYNIDYKSRLFLFSDYDLFQGDWEHTISFNVNRYLSTQIFAHARYDSSTPRYNQKWRKLQFKEIFSLGFTYKFGNA